MARIICLASGKGGVGKTVATANLAAALAQLGKSVIAVDGNLTTSNLGLHVGIPLYPVTFQDVLDGKVKAKDALYSHPAGFRIMPADVSITKIMTPNKHQFIDVFYELVDDADFVLIDCAAGLGREALAAVEASDEMITITNPELPAITDALKLGKFAESFETLNLGVIVNKVRGEKYELPLDDVKAFLNMPLIGKVSEDRNVKRAVARKQPVVLYSPGSRAARQFRAIATRLVGEKHRPVKRSYKSEGSGSIIHRLFGWLR